MQSSAVHMYKGQGFSLKGEKDRFVLPPTFRKQLILASGNAKTLCLAKHERWNCLVGFGTLRENDFEAQLDREEERATRLNKDFDRDLRAGQLLNFKPVPFDESGRFVIPDLLVDIGRVSRELYFRPGTPMFTLWNPEELAKMGEGWEADHAACTVLQRDAQNGKARK